MLTIRLQRGGKRNAPQYKLVLAQKTAANQKQFVEILGAYNPHTKELVIRDQERLNYWMDEQHAPLSATVHNLFVTKELIKADKKHAFAIPKKEVVAEEAPAESPTPEATATEGEATEEVLAVEEVPAEEAPTDEETPEAVTPEAPTPEPEPVVEESAAAETPAEEKAE